MSRPTQPEFDRALSAFRLAQLSFVNPSDLELSQEGAEERLEKQYVDAAIRLSTIVSRMVPRDQEA